MLLALGLCASLVPLWVGGKVVGQGGACGGTRSSESDTLGIALPPGPPIMLCVGSVGGSGLACVMAGRQLVEGLLASLDAAGPLCPPFKLEVLKRDFAVGSNGLSSFGSRKPMLRAKHLLC